MTWFLLALLSFLFNGLSAFCFKINAMNKGSAMGLLFGFYITGSISSAIYVWYSETWQWSTTIVFAGVIIGIGAAVGNLLYTKAVQTGPAGLTAMVSHSNVIFIVIMSLFIFDETITLLETISICFIIVGVLLLPFDPNQQLRIHNNSWYIFIGIVFVGFFIRNGGLKITDYLSLQSPSIILINYIVGLIGFSIMMLKNKDPSWAPVKIGLVPGMIAGVFSFATMQTFAHALEIGPASIIAPISSANGIVVALLAYFVYKERLSKFQFISFCLLLIGIICLKI